MFRINKRIILISIMPIIFVLILSNVVNAVTQCEVDQIKQALRKMLYRFYSNPNNVPFSVTEVKDLLLFYLSIDPNAVTIDCSVLGSSSNKAIFDIINIGKNVSDEIPKCTDGTQYGQCSGNRPKYCYAGAIYEKCETCGCPTNSFCGKSGKCESTIQNITCYNNIDCGTNKFVGDYYCSYNSIYKDMINYTCVNPGTNNSRCSTVNGSVWIAYCNPSLNQVCANGQNTCQTITKDNAPTVSIAVNPTSVAAGQAFNVTVTVTDDIGLAAIWWWAVDSTDTELNKAHWFNCNSAKYCSNSWLVSTNAVGTIKLGANSRDTSYPVAGEPHQASEGAGIAYATITVSGTQNISGGPPDLIISDFKSYTGTTNTYVTISATIKNIGGSVTEGNLCDSLYVETLNARGFCGAKLNPGETRVIQSDYALPMPGTYKIRADTDYGLLVAESNENNNVAWQTITVTSPYSADYVKANTDLTVTDIDVQLPTTSSGSTNVYVTTKNLGSLATGQYWVYTKVTNQDTGAVTKVQRLAPIVEPGGTYKTHPGEVGIKEYGTYKVEAFVDLDFYGGAYIYESNEDNNYLSKTVVYGTTNVTTESISLHNLSIVNENLIVEYSKNFITCVHLVTSNYGKTSIQNYYCTEGNNIAVSQPVSNFNVTAGQSYKLCHGNNYNICSSLKTLVNLTAPTVSCIDYDNGDNLFIASYAEKGTQKQYDKCGTAGQNYEIIEGVCANGQLSGVPHSCPTGTKCQNIRYEPAVYANVSACVNTTKTTNVRCEIDYNSNVQNNVKCTVNYLGQAASCVIPAASSGYHLCDPTPLIMIAQPEPNVGYSPVSGLSGTFENISCGTIETAYNTNYYFVNCKNPSNLNQTTTCSDGTQNNQCSSTKPLYCSNGTLINNCNICGCLSGQSCSSTGACQSGSCSKPLKTAASGITNGSYSTSLNSYFKIWAYSNSSATEKRYGYVDYSGWHSSGYDGGVWSVGKMYQSAKGIVIKVRNEAPDFSSPINFPTGALPLTIDGSQFNINMPAISSVCFKCNHWFMVYADGNVEKWPESGSLESWIDGMVNICPSS